MQADCFLVHAPSVFDFRDRDDMLFAYLSDSDSVNVTGVYEMYPLGFFSLQQRLREHGFATEIINLASIMLQHPRLDVRALVKELHAPVFGIDLHWMPHCHGALEVAKLIKEVHPEAKVMFGGISSTYFARELITYPQVDFVLRGYDTLEPVTALLQTINSGAHAFASIPNLSWKQAGEPVHNAFSHKPTRDYNDATVDWSFYQPETTMFTTPLIMTLPNTGCAMNCGWCGGSRYAYRNMMGVRKTLIQKDHARIEAELRSLGQAARRTSIYALQCYSETKDRLQRYFEVVREMAYKSVSVEMFHLPDEETLALMGRSTRTMIMLSPESHDPRISKLAGRGTYTMDEMEAWIPKALAHGVGVMIWFFIGMPEQSQDSVRDTVRYCERLLSKFPKQVLPLLCPMVPFLDPGSRFFEQPQQNGYRIFHKTLADHRRAMVEPLWHQRLNYETDFMSRREIQDISYEAIARLVSKKGESGHLPKRLATTILGLIDETTALLGEVERGIALEGRIPAALGPTVRDYNRKILATSRDQIVPSERPLGNRWFDDFTVPKELIAACERAA